MRIRRRHGVIRWAAPALLWGLTAQAGGGIAEPDGYWTGDADAPLPATLRGARVIHVEEAAALLQQRATVVVDASNAPRRPPELAPGAPWMPLPHAALPAALWLPGVGAGAIAPALDDFYRTRLQTATAGDVYAPLIVYCHDRCWLSWNAAKRAVEYGYRRVSWFPEGIEGWTAAGGRTANADPQGPAADPPAAAAQVPEAAPAPSATRPPAAAQAPADARLPALVVLDLELTGDLGGPDLVAQHEARLKTETARLRQDLEHTGLYQLVDAAAAQGTLDKLRSQQAYLHDCNGCDLDLGRELHADLVLVAWVDRVSGLILSLTYEIHDVKSGQIAARKSFDFRGDNDIAWNHAIDYLVRDLAKKQ
jgi:PQQ-dependent catabolism-associated CXXCW motif protein